jgi:uncharacterized protein (DUF58 family)
LRLEVAPHELQRLAQRFGGRLSLNALTEGPLSGHHKSRAMGASLNFAQHRDYVPGDDPKHLDWRAYAKSDRLVVRQYQQETNLRVFIVIDRSCSMAYQGGAEVSKGVYAAQLAAVAAWTLLLQGEAVGLATFGGSLTHLSPAASRREHFWRLLRALEASPWEPDTHPARALTSLAERLPPRSVVLVLTDGLDFAVSPELEEGRELRAARRSGRYERGGEGLSALAARLKSQGHRVSLMQLLDPHELSFPFDELSLFEGFEGEDPLKLDPSGVREAYLDELRALCDGLKRRSLSMGVRYARCSTGEPLERALAALSALSAPSDTEEVSP